MHGGDSGGKINGGYSPSDSGRGLENRQTMETDITDVWIDKAERRKMVGVRGSDYGNVGQSLHL